MRRAIAILSLAALILVAFIATGLVAPRPKTDASMASVQAGMSIYSLDTGHPNMKNLPVQDAPLP